MQGAACNTPTIRNSTNDRSPPAIRYHPARGVNGISGESLTEQHGISLRRNHRASRPFQDRIADGKSACLLEGDAPLC